MGKSGSPCSNSTHTPLPISGKVNTPMLMPATGTQGMAQLDNITFDTSGTIAWMRPICMGSTLITTVPRYLPKNFLGSLMAAPRHRRQQAVAREREVLVVLAALDRVRHALHVIKPIDGRARAAHAHQLPRLQDAAVTHDVERTVASHRVRMLRRIREAGHHRGERRLFGGGVQELDLGRQRRYRAERRIERSDVGDGDRDGNLRFLVLYEHHR